MSDELVRKREGHVSYLRSDTRADDMAELARSVSVPELKELVRLYREPSSN